MKRWILETRPQFLVLSLVLVAHGTALAAWQGSFNWWLTLLSSVALVLLQASVDVLNDWHDYHRSGIDHETPRTPFSGGSGMLPAGTMSPREALVLGIGTLVAGTAVGLYLALVAGPPLLIIGVIGVVSVVAYTPILTRIGLGEAVTGLTLGALPVVGVYFLLTGRLDAVAWVSGIPAALLTYNLLLLNEFPDTEADTAGGRHHMVVLLGKRNASRLYAVIEAGAFIAIALGVAFGTFSPWALLGLGGGIFGVQAIRTTLTHYDSFEGLLPAQASNIIAVLATNALMAIGYMIAALT
ncbi:MAG: prenyltransferase [Coriobacteriia bacterium]|nr:prenyltransferase [Coriobacteriia bacterium]MBN2822799.1 prenyltransferase [Coriobacteriia bacterium]